MKSIEAGLALAIVAVGVTVAAKSAWPRCTLDGGETSIECPKPTQCQWLSALDAKLGRPIAIHAFWIYEKACDFPKSTSQ